MLTLKELKFRAIGRFVEEQHIILDNLGSLIQVDAINQNTGGSSGAGKSTIFNALDFLFGLNSIPNSVLQSRLTEDPIWVEGIFDYDGLPLTITRSKKLKIELNGDVTTGSAKISEEKLDQILSIPRPLFKSLLHKEQGERGFFLNFTPKETNDFLIDCLGLGNFKKPLLEIDTKIRELTDLKTQWVHNKEVSQTGLEASKNAIVSLGVVPVPEVDRDTILALKNKADTSNELYKKLVEAQKLELLALETQRPVSIVNAFDTSKKIEYEQKLGDIKTQANQLLIANKDKESKIQAQIYEWQRKQSELMDNIERGKVAKEQATLHAAKILKIRSSMCPTCEQNWANDASKKEETQLLETITKLGKVVSEGVNSEIELENVVKLQIQNLRNSIPSATPEGYSELLDREHSIKAAINEQNGLESAHNSAQNAQNKAIQDNFALSHRMMRDRHLVDAEQLRGQASLDQKVLEGAVSKLKSFDEARKRYDQSFSSLVDQERQYQIQIDALSQEIEKLSHDIESYEELKRAVKSYLSCSFDEALDTISENATRLIGHIPNMANAVIRLIGIRETKEGKVKEEVTATIGVDGEENVDIRSLSGGERAAADLAIDLSVLDLIESKTNTGINVFILDEPFVSMDSVNSEQVLEMLKNAQIGKKVVIVDHNPIVKEFVSDRIIVDRTGQTSKVTQN